MKKTSLFFIPLFLLLLPALASAYELKAGNMVYLDEGEKLSGNVYAAGNTVTVKAPVEGDLFCAGQSVTVDADVAGDIFCAGQTITVNGKVGGSVRAAGNTVTVNGEVERNVQLLGAALTLGPEASAGWEMFIAGAFADIRGKVGRTLHGMAQSAAISGEVGGDVRLRIDSDVRAGQGAWNKDGGLVVADSARINGNLYYTAVRPGQVSDQAEIKGEVGYSETKIKESKRAGWSPAWGGLYSLFASLVIGLVLVSLLRKPLLDLTDKMQEKPWPAIGWGAVVLFLGPFALIVLVLTIIGLPLALILFALWLIAVYTAKVLSGIMAGRWLMARFASGQKESLIWAMVLGVAAVSLACLLPLVGWLIGFAATLWGLGGIWLYFKE